MTLDPQQLEWIVQEVLRRLDERRVDGMSKAAMNGDLYLTDRLVTTVTLRGRLKNVRQVAVDAKTIVTPAARDLLHDHDVKLVRRKQ